MPESIFDRVDRVATTSTSTTTSSAGGSLFDRVDAELQNDSGSAPGGVGSPLGVVAADGVRRGAVRVGEEIATSPKLGRVVGFVSSPAARKLAKAAGVYTNSLPGYITGEVLTSPAVTKAAEVGIRNGAGIVARVAGSRLVRAATGFPGFIASMPFTEPGDRSVGPETTAERQARFRVEYDAMLKAKQQRR